MKKTCILLGIAGSSAFEMVIYKKDVFGWYTSEKILSSLFQCKCSFASYAPWKLEMKSPRLFSVANQSGDSQARLAKESGEESPPFRCTPWGRLISFPGAWARDLWGDFSVTLCQLDRSPFPPTPLPPPPFPGATPHRD